MSNNQAPTRTREDILEDIGEIVNNYHYVDDEAADKITLLCDELIALAEARARSEAEAARGGETVEWRPIETAPKDGTSILTWQPLDGHRSVCETRWLASGPYMHRVDGLRIQREPGWYWSGWNGPVGPIPEPILWTYLPDPPRASNNPEPPDDSAEKIARLKAEVARLREALCVAHADTQRIDWLGRQDVIIGNATWNWRGAPLLARYQATYPADLDDIRVTFDKARALASAPTQGGEG